MLDRVQEEYVRKRIMSIMLCTKMGLCRESSRTIFQLEEEILSMVLDFKIDVPCVVQWSPLWLSAPTDLNRFMGGELEIKKYHEVVHVDFGGQSAAAHTQKERN